MRPSLEDSVTRTVAFAHPAPVRRRAVKALPEHASYRQASSALGIPRSTLHRWAQVKGISTGGSAAKALSAAVDNNIDPNAEPGSEGIDPDVVAEQTAGDPITADAEGTSLDDGTNTDPGIPDLAERLSDTLYLRALHRWTNLIANDVRPDHAMKAALAIDPSFYLSDEEQERLQSAIGAAEFSEPARLRFGVDTPPTSTMRDFQLKPTDVNDIADSLEELHTNAAVDAINTQMRRIGRDPIDAITDPATLERIRADAQDAAVGIGKTWNTGVIAEAQAQWLAMPSTEYATAQDRRDALTLRLGDWRDGRAALKDDQVTTTEAAAAWSSATQEFADNNASVIIGGYVEPQDAVCQDCQDLVDMGDEANPADWDTINAHDFPVHVNCDHSPQPVYAAVAQDTPVWNGQGEPDVGTEMVTADQATA